MSIALSIALSVALFALVILFLRLRKLNATHHALGQERDALTDRFRDVVDVEAEKQRVLSGLETERTRLQSDMQHARSEQERSIQILREQHRHGATELAKLQANIARLSEEFRVLDEEANIQSFGFYKPRYDLVSSDR